MTLPQQITAIFIVFIFLLVLIFDLIMWIYFDQATITSVVQALSDKHPSIKFIALPPMIWLYYHLFLE